MKLARAAPANKDFCLVRASRANDAERKRAFVVRREGARTNAWIGQALSANGVVGIRLAGRGRGQLPSPKCWSDRERPT